MMSCCHTQVLDLNCVSILQLGAGDGHALVVRNGRAFALCDTQAVNRELGLGGNAFIQVGGAALNVDLGLLRKVRDWFA